MSEITIEQLAAMSSLKDDLGAQRDYAYDASHDCACTIAEATVRAMRRWTSDDARIRSSAPYWAVYALAALADVFMPGPGLKVDDA